MGQIVQFVNPIMSKDFLIALSQLPPMPTENDQLRINQEVCARVKKLREDRGWTAHQMAVALNVPADRYRKYETRSPLPIYLLERFALITGVTVEYLVTGRAKRDTASESERKAG